MSYLGREPAFGNLEVQQLPVFDGLTTTVNLIFSVGTASSLLVVLDGSLLQPGVDYSVSPDGNELAFATAPLISSVGHIIYVGKQLSVPRSVGQEISRQSILGNDVLTSFSLNSVPVVPEAILVIKNGMVLELGVDYTVSGSTLTFPIAPMTTDTVSVVFLAQEKVSIDTVRDQSITRNKFFPGSLLAQDVLVNEGSSTVEAEFDALYGENGADKIGYKIPGFGNPQISVGQFLDSVANLEYSLPEIRAPFPISPLTGTSGALVNLTLEATAYSPVYSSDIRDYREFQVASLADTTFSTLIFTTQVNANTVAVSPALAIDSSYRWRCRDVSILGDVSDWMEVQTFTTANISINTPTVLVEGEPTDVVQDPLITTSAFDTTPAGQDTHQATDWEVRLASNNSLVYSNYGDTINLTSLVLPIGVLLENTQYKFRARHVGAIYGASAYGEKIATTELAFDFGRYLGVAHVTSPFTTIYGQDVDTFTKLADPAALPAGQGQGCAFSRDGVYFAVAHQVTPFIAIYKRSGDVFTKLADPATLPASTGLSCAFSADGTYLAVAHITTPFITIYKRSGDVFTKLADPATLPTGTGRGCTFSADGTYLAVAHSTSPFIAIYKRSGDVFTKLANPATLPASTGLSCAFSADGTYLAVANNGGSPYITIYKRSGDVFTKLTNPATLPPNDANGCAFSADGTYLAVAHFVSPFVTIYKRSGDVFTKLADPATLPASIGRSCAFSADGFYLVVGHDTTPFITIYKRAGDVFTKLANPATLPTGQGNGTAFFPRAFEGVQVGPFSVAALQPTGSFSVATQETVTRGLAFHTNGTKMFIVGQTNDRVYEYNLSIPWDVTSATVGNNFIVADNTTGIAFRPDGLKMYVSVSATLSIYEYTLSVAWDVTTASQTNTFAAGNGIEGLAFHSDGTKMFVVDSTQDNVEEYTLSTPWNVSTAVSAGTFSVAAQDATPTGIHFKQDGTKMYIIGQTNDKMYEYNLTTPWLLSSAVFLQEFNVSTQSTAPEDIFVRTDNGTNIYQVGNNIVYQYNTLEAI